MKKLIIGLVAIVVLVAGAALAIPLFISAESVRAELVQRLQQATGRGARIDGDVSISILPFTRFSAEGIGLSGITDDEDAFSVESVSFGLNLFALLSGNVEISSVTLVRPQIVFDQSGTAGTAAPSGDAAEDGTAVAGAINRLRLGTVSVSDGRVIWRGRDGAEQTFSAVNLTAKVPTLAEGGTVNGNLVWRDTKFEVRMTLGANAANVELARLPLEFSVTTDVARLLGSGQVFPEGGIFAGNFTFEGNSLGQAIAIVGGAAPDAPAFGTFSVTGRLQAAEAALTLEEFAISLEGLRARGAAQAAFDRDRPGVGLRLAAEMVDLNAFVPQPGNASSGGSGGSSSAPDLSAARLADANIELTAQSLFAGNMRIDGLSATASLANGVLTATARSSAISGMPDVGGVELQGVNVTADLTDLDKAATIGGTASWRGESFQLEATAAPSALLSSRSARIAAKATSRRVTAGYTGTIAGATTGDGEINVSTPSLRGLLAWLGQPIGEGGGLQAFSFQGPVKLSDGTVAFENASFSLDGSSGRANGSVAYGGAKPSIKAGIALQTLNLTPYVSGSGSGSGGGSGGGSGAWSSAPIAFDGLKAIDAALNLNAEQIVLDRIKTGRTALTANLANGVLDAELGQMSLYGGNGTGRLKVDGAARTPAIAANFNLGGLSARAFLADAIGLGRVDGRGNFAMDLSTAGGSTMALMQGLQGRASFEVSNGVITGINIGQMMQALTQNILQGWNLSSNQGTEFSRFNASFAVDKGIATTSDLTLVGPLVQVTGTGSINIPDQSVSFRVDPRIAAGNNQNLAGLQVPVVIEGPWASPRIYPQIDGILQNPSQALEQLRGLGGLFGIGGGGAGGGQSGGQSGGSNNPADILRGIFGGGNSGSGGGQAAPAPRPDAAPQAQGGSRGAENRNDRGGRAPAAEAGANGTEGQSDAPEAENEPEGADAETPPAEEQRQPRPEDILRQLFNR